MVLGIVVGGAVLDLLAIRSDLGAGKARLDRLDLDTLRADGLEGSLTSAAADLDDAADRASSSPFLAAVGAVPLLDDQVRAVERLTAAADELGAEARVTGARIGDALERAGGNPRARVELLDVVLEELDRVEAVAAGIDLGPSDGVVGPLRSARTEVADALADVPTRLAPLRRQVRALRALLAGPSSYLVVVGNNAEMRAGAGMPLTAGLATIGEGDIELGEFESTVSELYAPNPTGPYNSDVPEPLQETYPRWNLGRDFPETAVIPHFPVTAPMYADIAADTQGWRVDGVLHIDAMALAELLGVVGPVEIGGRTYTQETAPQLVLNQPYLDFRDRSVREERQDAQGELANALFEAIQDRDVELLDVVAALQRAAEGRHLMAWSRDPVLQDLFDSFGAAGAIGPDEILVSFQNTGANKLDWYVTPWVDVTLEPLEDEWRVTLVGSIHNPARVETSSYIDGIQPELAGGTHRVLLSVQVPANATRLDVVDRVVTEHGFDGVSKVIGARFTIPRGATRHATVSFRLPGDTRVLRIAPSARVEPVAWTIEGRPFHDDVPFIVGIPPLPDPMEPAAELTAWSAVFLALVATVMMGNAARSAGPSPRARRAYAVDAVTGAALYFLAALFLGAAFFLA